MFRASLDKLRINSYLGASGGSKPVKTTGGSPTISEAQLPAHRHLAAIYRESLYTGSMGSGGYFSGDAVNIADTDPTGGGQAYWPPYLAVNLIIKMG